MDEENQILMEKLKQVKLPVNHNDDRLTNAPGSASQREQKKMFMITEDTYFKCQRLAEQMQAYKQFLMFLQQREGLNADEL